MASKQKVEKDYDDIPGTYVFDADRSREGYHLNMFCMSLMKAENRKAFKENEARYLDDHFPQLTAEQREAVDALSSVINGNPREALLRRAGGARRS